MGTLLGNRYELLEKIGEGGMAIVYKAKCHLLDRYVAVKILKEEFNNDEEFVEKFKQEATAVASLSHTNIVNIYDVGSENNMNYIVMEYVDGKTLKEIIKENIRLSYSKTISIAIQIAAALECAHKNNLIHRDIKPHNILVTNEGVAKVADFGIAKVASSVTITNSSQIMGSAHYFSPEQAKGGFVDSKTDIYSLGIVMYEMITGKVPYDADSPVSVAIKHIQEPAIPPKQIVWDIPENLNRLILKAIEKEPIKRYQSARELLTDLNSIKENPNHEVKLSNVEDDFTRVMAPVNLSNNMNGTNNTNSMNSNEDEGNDMGNNKLTRNKKIILIVASCLIMAIIGIVAGKLLAGSSGSSTSTTNNKTVKVPALIGKPSSDVQKEVVALGLKYVVAEQQVSDQQEGTVIKSNHNEGEMVEPGTYIRVYVSSGPEVSKVRDVVNKPLSFAEDALTSDGYLIGTKSEEFSDTYPAGYVIKTTPEADTSYQKGKKVDILVSRGPKGVTVPDLYFKTVDEATTILNNLGLKLSANPMPTSDANVKANDGKIFLQDVKNTSVPKGTTINVTYYKYAEDSGQ